MFGNKKISDTLATLTARTEALEDIAKCAFAEITRLEGKIEDRPKPRKKYSVSVAGVTETLVADKVIYDRVGCTTFYINDEVVAYYPAIESFRALKTLDESN